MIDYACIVPHAPVLVKEVAQDRYVEVEATGEAFASVAASLKRHQPDTVVLISPHGPNQRASFVVCTKAAVEGDLSRFRCPAAHTRAVVDTELAAELLKEPDTCPSTEWGENLDWGASVPLLCLQDGLGQARLLLVGICGRDPRTHYHLGRLLERAIARLQRKVAIICSADLSHTVKPETPAGARFDHDYCQAVADWDVDWVLSRTPQDRRRAAEDAVPQTSILMGALYERQVKPKVLSYQAPFGVGYMVAEVELV